MSKSDQVQARETASALLQTAATPPTAPSLTRGQELLLYFLRDPPHAPNAPHDGDPHDGDPHTGEPPAWSDAPPRCPVCGYNLRGLTRPVCPECRHDLVLTVGVQAGRLRLGWLLIALVPGFFCGIAACLLAIPTTAIYFEDGVIVWPFVGGVLFGWCSGIFAIALVVPPTRNRFIAQPRSRQRSIVLILAFIHFIAFVLFFGWMASQI